MCPYAMLVLITGRRFTLDTLSRGFQLVLMYKMETLKGLGHHVSSS